MNILVIDAQGGGIGRQIITAVKKNFPEKAFDLLHDGIKGKFMYLVSK